MRFLLWGKLPDFRCIGRSAAGFENRAYLLCAAEDGGAPRKN
jgi:hypothetical protein